MALWVSAYVFCGVVSFIVYHRFWREEDHYYSDATKENLWGAVALFAWPVTLIYVVILILFGLLSMAGEWIRGKN